MHRRCYLMKPWVAMIMAEAAEAAEAPLPPLEAAPAAEAAEVAGAAAPVGAALRRAVPGPVRGQGSAVNQARQAAGVQAAPPCRAFLTKGPVAVHRRQRHTPRPMHRRRGRI